MDNVKMFRNSSRLSIKQGMWNIHHLLIVQEDEKIRHCFEASQMIEFVTR